MMGCFYIITVYTRSGSEHRVYCSSLEYCRQKMALIAREGLLLETHEDRDHLGYVPPSQIVGLEAERRPL